MDTFKAYDVAMELATITKFLRTSPTDPISATPCEFYGDDQIHIVKTDDTVAAYVVTRPPNRRELVFSFSLALWEIFVIRPGNWMDYVKSLMREVKKSQKAKNAFDLNVVPYESNSVL